MNIKELAEQAGYKVLPTVRLAFQGFDKEKFAELVAAHEREECAKLFELTHKDLTVPPVHFSLSDTAKIIRARGKA